MDRGAWRATVHGILKSWTWLRALTHFKVYGRSKGVEVALRSGCLGVEMGERSLADIGNIGCLALLQKIFPTQG